MRITCEKKIKSPFAVTLTAACLSLLVFISIAAIQPSDAKAACQVTLAWDKVNSGNLSGYRLFLRTQNQSYSYQNPIWEGANNQCTISDLSEQTAYYFVVRAVDDKGNEGDNSNEVRFSLDLNRPRAPEVISPADGAQGVALEAELSTGGFYDIDAEDYHIATYWQVRRVSDNHLCFSLFSYSFLTDLTLPPNVLNGSTSYEWTAQHVNQNGAYSDPGRGRFTTTDRPPPTNLGGGGGGGGGGGCFIKSLGLF